MNKYGMNHWSGLVFGMLGLLLGLFVATGNKHLKRAESVDAEPAILVDAEANIKNLGIVLPPVSPPVANYVNAVRSGNLIFLAGKGPKQLDGKYITGKVGRDLTQDQGFAAARLTAINQLAALKQEIGSLNKVKRIVKVRGMVNATEDFENHPEVINGFSNLIVDVFGENGKHARAAVGMQSLPRNIAVEIEMIVEVENK